MAIGIYKIENKINHKCYIGQSIHIEKRWKDEITAALNPTAQSYNYPLQSDIREYGVKNFDFSILEECSKEELNQKERFWIAEYDSHTKGYNQTSGGGSGDRGKSDRILGIISDLKETNMLHREIAEKWDISMEMVQGINTGRYWFDEQEDYPLQKNVQPQASRISQIYTCAICGKEITKGATLCTECANIASRKVKNRPSKEELYNYLVSIKGNFSEAGRYFGVSDNAVRKWCIAYEIPNKSADYRIKKETASRDTNPQKVAQIDPVNGQIIKIYASASEAAQALGKEGGTHISAVCNGKRQTAYGYKWKKIDKS